MIKRAAAGVAVVAVMMTVLGGTASAGTRVTSGPSGDMTYNSVSTFDRER